MVGDDDVDRASPDGGEEGLVFRSMSARVSTDVVIYEPGHDDVALTGGQVFAIGDLTVYAGEVPRPVCADPGIYGGTHLSTICTIQWSVNAARVAVSAPWLILLLLATQQQTLVAYDSPTGVVILAAGAGLSVFAYRLMMRIGRLPEERRVLR